MRNLSSHSHIVVGARTFQTNASAPPLLMSLLMEASKLGGTPLLPSSLPLVDLGGVNNSCNVLLEGWVVFSPSNDGDDDNNNNNNDNDNDDKYDNDDYNNDDNDGANRNHG
jgi:hypothetical protein